MSATLRCQESVDDGAMEVGAMRLAQVWRTVASGRAQTEGTREAGPSSTTAKKARGWRRAGGVAAAGIAVVGLAGCAVPRWQSELASVNGAGTDSGDGPSWGPVLSPDGTKMVFESRASNLGATDTNGAADVYVRDLATGATSLVSVNAAGTDSGNAGSMFPQFSPDGSKVSFVSSASDLASPATDGHSNLFVRDLAAGTTSLVSVNASGTGGDDQGVGAGDFSPDGDRVMFASDSHNLVSPDPGGPTAIFERNLATGVTTRLTEGWSAEYAPTGDVIAFVNAGQVYLRNMSTGAVTPISTGVPDITGSGRLVFSPDGTKVAFERRNVSGQIRTNIYVHDRVAHTTSLVTAAAGGTGGSNNTPSRIYGFDPTNSNRLLFSSAASNLVSNDGNGAQEDVFVRNLSARVTRLVSVTGAGSASGSGLSTQAAWVGDGTKIAFVSHGSQFGPADANAALDVYVKDETAGTYRLVSLDAAGTSSANGQSGRYDRNFEVSIRLYELSVSADGSRIAYGSDAGNLGATDSDRLDDHDVYVARLVTPPS